MDARSFLLALGLLALPPLALTQSGGESGDGDRPAPAADSQQRPESPASEAAPAGKQAEEKPEARSRNFRPSERIRADQGVDFPADI